MTVNEKLDYIMENIIGFQYFAPFSGNCTLDCKGIADYTKLSADNFLLFPKTISSNISQNYNNLGQGTGNATSNIYTQYDAVQGILTIYANFRVDQSNAGGFNFAYGNVNGYVYIIPSNIFINE